ncbi:MAG TPA: 4Fe-4S dicluster domain-containing protein [Caldilineaceae bacterium]|nr:4Fe-4S dicluster domain-containing protein [Caldilineaceae bacterium]
MSVKSEAPRQPSRRAFLKDLGAAVLLAAAFQPRAAAAANADHEADDALAVLIDLTRCTGCQSCVLACQETNIGLCSDRYPDRLSSSAYSYLAQTTPLDANGDPVSQPVKRQCMNCLHPACVSACTVGALRKQPQGPVTYDSSKCIGCRYCQYACPFGIPTYDWNNPLGLIHKCDFCAERTLAGEEPACVAACPNGALRFGRRSALLAQAHAQIESNPGRYVNHIYGEHEAGGASMLYLSAFPFEQLGFPALGSEAIAEQSEAIMAQTLPVAFGVAALATALHLITRRHRQLAAEHTQTASSPEQSNTERTTDL